MKRLLSLRGNWSFSHRKVGVGVPSTIASRTTVTLSGAWIDRRGTRKRTGTWTTTSSEKFSFCGCRSGISNCWKSSGLTNAVSSTPVVAGRFERAGPVGRSILAKASTGTKEVSSIGVELGTIIKRASLRTSPAGLWASNVYTAVSSGRALSKRIHAVFDGIS